MLTVFSTPGNPKTNLCPLVGSGILDMDHPKDHSLFGLRLPGIKLHSPKTNLSGAMLGFREGIMC